MRQTMEQVSEPEDEHTKPETVVTPIRARSIITRNNSPDVGFNLSVNPYQGCEHRQTFPGRTAALRPGPPISLTQYRAIQAAIAGSTLIVLA
jgi:hypothetical protein